MWPHKAGGRSRRGSPKAGTTVTAARGAACQFGSVPNELPVCPDCSVYNSQAAEQVIQVT